MEKEEDDHACDATKYLMKSLETSMYQPQYTKQAWALRELLSKLGIKSAKNNGLVYGGVLRMEGLDSILKSMTFNSDHLKLRKKSK